MVQPRIRNFVLGEIFCLALFLIESLIKYSLINKIPKQGFYFLGGLIQFVFSSNTNLAFSLPLPQVLIIILVFIILILLGFSWVVSLLRNNLWEVFSFSLIILGALSNLLDRLFFGYVIDYINLFFWPVFNLADSMIVVGVLIYILSEFKIKARNVNQT